MPSEIGEAAIAVARKQRKPTAIEMVACAWDTLWNYGTWQGKVYAPISYLRTRAALAKASHVIYVTEKFLQTRYPTNGKSAAVSDVVISPSSPDVLKRRVARESADRRSMNIGLVGNLSPIKGIGTLIRAASYLRQRKVPKFELRFLGGGAQERWQKLAHKLGVGVLCDFCGVRPPGRAVWEWLDAIDIYVQPSCTEGLPRATVEAMSRACPVIGSAVGGLPELLPRENMHRPRDARRLADLIEKMLMTPTWRVECSRANFYKAQDYSLDVLDRRRQAFWCNFTEGILASHDCRNNRRVIV
jgi:glycosyltransferase involved in cell wall biosynthesis